MTSILMCTSLMLFTQNQNLTKNVTIGWQYIVQEKGWPRRVDINKSPPWCNVMRSYINDTRREEHHSCWDMNW